MAKKELSEAEVDRKIQRIMEAAGKTWAELRRQGKLGAITVAHKRTGGAQMTALGRKLRAAAAKFKEPGGIWDRAYWRRKAETEGVTWDLRLVIDPGYETEEPVAVLAKFKKRRYFTPDMRRKVIEAARAVIAAEVVALEKANGVVVAKQFGTARKRTKPSGKR